jgi:hypothetical protein
MTDETTTLETVAAPVASAPVPFDISSLAADETFDVEILNPKTGEALIGDGGKPCSVTVYGPGTKPFAAARSRASNRAVKRLRSKGSKSDTTPEEELAATASFLTDITKSFNNFGYKGMPAGAEAHRALYLDPHMGFITEQVNVGAGDWGNFTKG